MPEELSLMTIAAASELERWQRSRTHHAQHMVIDCLILPHAKSCWRVDVSADAEDDWHGESEVSLVDALRDLKPTE
jgi:hypothetical protein